MTHVLRDSWDNWPIQVMNIKMALKVLSTLYILSNTQASELRTEVLQSIHCATLQRSLFPYE